MWVRYFHDTNYCHIRVDVLQKLAHYFLFIVFGNITDFYVILGLYSHLVMGSCTYDFVIRNKHSLTNFLFLYMNFFVTI